MHSSEEHRVFMERLHIRSTSISRVGIKEDMFSGHNANKLEMNRKKVI